MDSGHVVGDCGCSRLWRRRRGAGDAFGEWHKGRTAIREDLAFVHNGPLKNNQKKHKVEKIRLLRPAIAVVQVSAQSGVENLGTYVLQKQRENS